MVEGRCCWGQCSLEEVGGETFVNRDPARSKPAGEGRGKSRAAAFIPQVLLSWFREGKVINFSCLQFVAPWKTLPKNCFQPQSNCLAEDRGTTKLDRCQEATDMGQRALGGKIKPP